MTSSETRLDITRPLATAISADIEALLATGYRPKNLREAKRDLTRSVQRFMERQRASLRLAAHQLIDESEAKLVEQVAPFRERLQADIRALEAEHRAKVTAVESRFETEVAPLRDQHTTRVHDVQSLLGTRLLEADSITKKALRAIHSLTGEANQDNRVFMEAFD